MARGHIINRGKHNKNKKPNWGFVVDAGYDDRGRRKRVWRSGYATRREAEDALALFLAELAAGRPPNAPQPKRRGPKVLRAGQPLADYLRDWLANRSVQDTTAANYRWLIEKHIVPEIGDVLLANLNQDHVRKLYGAKAGYSLNTRQRLHGVLRAALEDAVEDGLIAKNPCSRKLRPAREGIFNRNLSYSVAEIDDIPDDEDGDNERINAMTDEELDRFLQAVRGTRFFAAHLLAIRRGLRRGEILGLRWRDIDFRRKTLTVRRSLVLCQGRPVFHGPKTRRSKRTISLSDEILDALKEHRQRQKEQQMARRDVYRDYDLVFCTIDGRPYCPNRFRERHFKKHLRQAGLPDFRFHDLRHTAATMMLKDGVHVKVVSEVLGHASEAFTLRVYGHVLPGMQESALKKYDAARI